MTGGLQLVLVIVSLVSFSIAFSTHISFFNNQVIFKLADNVSFN